MFRKKLLSKVVILSLALAISGVSGCGNKTEQSEVIVEETTPVETITAEESTSVVETAVDIAETVTEPETIEIAETEETTEQSTDVAFEPYIMYTNTNCNIRSEASADSDVVGLYNINVEVTVIGEENGWSKLEYDGCIAYIKSSLLSDAPVKTSSKGSTSSGSGKSGTSTPSASSSTGSSSSSGLTPEEQALLDSWGRAEDSYNDTPSRYDSMTEAERQAESQRLADYVQEHNVYVQ